MKRIATLFLAAAMLLGAAPGAGAIDFKAEGEWLMGFGVGKTDFINKIHDGGGKHKYSSDDAFTATQRLRLQLDAVASESLSGTVFFQIGDTTWGKDDEGGAMGADRTNTIALHAAYLDWAVPSTDLKIRMGLQTVALPNTAGGGAVLDTQMAGITASYQFNDNVGLTALWARPFNDNYNDGYTYWNDSSNRANYLDNMDLFALLLPLKFDGFEATPWLMYGMRGKNSAKFDAYDANELADGSPVFTLGPYPYTALPASSVNPNVHPVGKTSKAYGSMFWAGLPLAVTAWDPLNIELDINYGYVESMGRYDLYKRGQFHGRGSTERQGWLAKALIEYKMDWGAPGIFGWYASGDDGNPKNGSERMPSLCPYGNFTSFIGDGNLGWASGNYYDRNTSYAGTWGIGARITDVSFVENLKHAFTVAYWGGTNSPSMAKYMMTAWDWDNGTLEGPYMTKNDGLLEFNLINSWQIYENLEMNFELGYVVNFMDNGTWKKTNSGRETSFEKQDIWKAQVVFAYTF
ncbi:MAG: outer membrane homotrimeric porin [Desulfovibrio sp.]|nr:outer membrane homotrimeric porin [Desulfovibrio sp.]